MRYVKQFMQKTIKSDDPVIFDEMINSVYLKAAEGGKEPEIHYYDGMGFCATVKFFINQTIAEDAKDEFEMIGDYHFCSECPYFELPGDRRIRHFHCHKGKSISTDSRACNDFYEALKKGVLQDGIPE